MSQTSVLPSNTEFPLSEEELPSYEELTARVTEQDRWLSEQSLIIAQLRGLVESLQGEIVALQRHQPKDPSAPVRRPTRGGPLARRYEPARVPRPSAARSATS